MNGFLVLALLVAGAIILWLLSRTSSLTQEVAKAQREVNRISGRIQQEAMAQFQAWRQKEYDTLKNQEAEVADREAQVKLAQWKVASETGIRADAIQRSQSVIVGKVTEHIVPYLPEFSYNPKDARFIGSPVDFVVFDGLDQGAVGQVVFIEVKTGSGSLTKRERQVRDAVLAKNVTWVEMRVEPPDGRVVAVEATTTAAAAPPAADSTSWPGWLLPSFSTERTNAIRLPSGDQRGVVSRIPDVRRRGDSEPAAAAVNRDDSYRFSFSLTVTRTNATVDPSGAICGSAIQVNLNRSFSAMNRFVCPCVDAAATTTAQARAASDARRIMKSSNQQSAIQLAICN